MAHVITEVATFTPTITVPDGVDTMVDAAEVVTAIAQGLANRSRALKAVTDVAARTNIANNFTALQVFSAGLTVSAGAFQSLAATVTTLNASGAVAFANTLAVTGVTTVGALHVLGTSQLDNNLNITGSLAATAQVQGATVVSTGTVTAATTITATAGNLRLQNNTRIVEYISPSFVERVVPIAEGISRDAANTELDADYWEQTGGGVGLIDFPIRTPDGAVLSQARMISFAPASANQLSLFGRSIDWNTTPQTPPSFGSNIVTTVSTTHATDAVITTVTIPSVPVDNLTEEFKLTVLLGATGNRLYALRLIYADPGLTNR